MTTSVQDRAIVAQARFRVLLRALARPGLSVSLAEPEQPRAVPGTGYLLAVAEALLDHEVGFVVAGDGLDDSDAAAFTDEVRLRTGSQPVAAAEARFVLVFGAAGAALEMLSPGSYEYPDESATLLWHAPRDAPARRVTLSGPGVEGALTLDLPAIGADDLAALARVNTGYPTGLDLFVVGADGHVVGLPRSVRCTVNG